MIGSLKGSLAAMWGIWVVDWETNTWTPVTPMEKTDTYLEPIMYSSDYVAVEPPAPAGRLVRPSAAASAIAVADVTTVCLEPGDRGVRLYALSGTQLWQFRRDSAARRETIAVPASLKGAPVLVRYER